MSDTQRNKRRASMSHPDEPVKKRGRPSKALLATKVPEGSMSRRQAQAMLSRHPALRYPSDQEAAFYDDLVRWPAGHDWTEEDKAEVDEEWDRSQLKQASERLNTPQYASLFLLFKISLRLYRITPIELLSPLGGLRYQAVSKSPQCSEWIMSATFCDLLSALMVHPCWEENLDFLSLALKWTVTCRLDSSFAWPCDAKVACSVLKRVLGKLKGSLNKRLSVSYHEMHKAERERASERGTLISTLSDILFEIGEAVPKQKAKKPVVHPKYDTMFGYTVLPVTVWDLKLLTGVVNSMDFKPEWNYSPNEALDAWKVLNTGAELPAQERLTDIYMHTYKGIFRCLRLERRELDAVQGMEEAEDDENQSHDPTSSSDDGEDQSPDLTSSSDDNEFELEASSPHHHRRRPTIVDDSGGEESESTSRNIIRRSRRTLQAVVTDSSDEESESIPASTGRLSTFRYRHVVRDVEEEDDSPEGLDDFSPYPQPDLRDRGEDDDTTDNAFGSGQFIPQDTYEPHEFRPRGPTLAEILPQRPPGSPIYTSVRETKMLSELSELRKENKELRDGQKRLQDLFAQGVKQQNEVIAQKDRQIARLLKEQNDLIRKGQDEQKQQMLDMRNEQKKQMGDLMKELESMKSELTQSRQAKEAPDQGDAEQSHPERPSLPEVTDIVPDATLRSPELGTNLSAPPSDFEVLEETIVVVPTQEDIAPAQPVPKQKTPEPEGPQQPATTAQKQATEPVFGNLNPARRDEDRTQEVPQLPGAIDETPSTHTETKSSEQSSDLPPWPVLAPNPPMPRRNIARLACTGGGRFSVKSDARDIFVTPRSEVLKILKGYK